MSKLTDSNEFLNDSKYRQYVAAVEKALKTFEYPTEWADLISALGKLHKVNDVYFYTLHLGLNKLLKVIFKIF